VQVDNKEIFAQTEIEYGEMGVNTEKEDTNNTVDS